MEYTSKPTVEHTVCCKPLLRRWGVWTASDEFIINLSLILLEARDCAWDK